MKILQNPAVVGILVVVAGALIFVQLWPMIHHAAPPPLAAQAPAQAPSSADTVSQPAATPAAAPAVTNAPAAVPAAPIEVAAISTGAENWDKSPQRDPFQARMEDTNAPSSYPPASKLLALKAIWRQTDSTLAVVNDQVVAEGDTILRFNITSIEDGRIWVKGPNGRESVELYPAPTGP
jgi:hypothetical protein